MKGRRRKPREKDLTGRYLGGDFDEDRIDPRQRFSNRSKHAERNKIRRTAAMRADQQEESGDEVESLPVGEVIQVYSLYSEVEHEGTRYLCVVRKTLARVRRTGIVVGDLVRLRPTGTFHESGLPEASIERVLDRRTVLTRAESLHGHEQHPIVANAEQMLIVASLLHPRVRWGLIDRMIVAARSGGLAPVICLNKIDLAEGAGEGAEAGAPDELAQARSALSHYESLGVPALQTSAERKIGLDDLGDRLRGRVTVLAGHSGVGKSSLIRAIEPGLDLRVAAVSGYSFKGRHTTTSARRYPLSFGGAVIDTPGVRQFGLWGVGRENLIDYFPDVENETAPDWRRESYERILASLGERS